MNYHNIFNIKLFCYLYNLAYVLYSLKDFMIILERENYFLKMYDCRDPKSVRLHIVPSSVLHRLVLYIIIRFISTAHKNEQFWLSAQAKFEYLLNYYVSNTECQLCTCSLEISLCCMLTFILTRRDSTLFKIKLCTS